MNEERPDLELTTWKPSPAMFGTMHRALVQLSHTWPKPFALVHDNSDAGKEFVANFSFAMKWVDLRAIPLAAREWIATQKFAPKPAELAELTRALTRKHFPSLRETKPAESRGLYDGARAFWFAYDGHHEGYGRLDAERAIAFELRSGDRIGIGDAFDKEIRSGAREWGWLNASDVPAFSAPVEYFAPKTRIAS